MVVLDQVTDPQRRAGYCARRRPSARSPWCSRARRTPVTSALAKPLGRPRTAASRTRSSISHAHSTDEASGFWVCGLEANAQQTLADLDLAIGRGRARLEGGGMRRLYASVATISRDCRPAARRRRSMSPAPRDRPL